MLGKIILAVLIATAFACVDKVDNVVTLSDCGAADAPIEFVDLLGYSYDTNDQPACKGNTANLKMPGYLTVGNGSMKVKVAQKLDNTSIINLTLKKTSGIFRIVACNNGKPVLPIPALQQICSFHFCEFIGNAVCNKIDTVGTHPITDLGIPGTIKTPDLGIWTAEVKGTWSLGGSVMTGGKTIGCIINSNVNVDNS